MDIVFGTKWFERHQSKLLWLLNSSITKRWFRYVLRIHKDCPTEQIVKILPSSYTTFLGFKNGEIELKTDFRTHDKFSKRLYYAFKPIWYTMHFLDWAMLDRVEALTKLSFGFSTLTVYPDPSTSVDGIVLKQTVQSTWSGIHDAPDGTAVDYTSTVADFCAVRADAVDPLSNRWFKITRGFFLFDTSPLTAGVTISAAVMSLYGQSTNNTGTNSPTIDIFTSTPASNTVLDVADYDQVGTTSQTGGSAIAIGSFNTAGYNDFTFSSTGIGNISKTGISKFGTREAAYDATNTTPTWSATMYVQFTGYFAEQTGTSQDPKLVVTYAGAVITGNFFPFFY